MNFAQRSLQGRLLLMVLGIVALVWTATATATWFDVRRELDDLLDGHLAQAAALLVVQQGAEIEEHLEGVDAPTLHHYSPKVAFQVFHEGRLALRSANAPSQPMAGAAAPFETGFSTVQIDGVDWRVFTALGPEHDVRAYVGERIASRSEILRAVLRSTLWPMALGLPVLALAAAWAVSSGVAPVRRLGRTLAQRAPQALGPVDAGDAPAEMLPMVDALNGLLARIATVLEQERRFTADAAHELRTPIAAIRAQAQVAAAEPDGQARQGALRRTLEGCDRAARLVDQMLTLSRLESSADGAGPALAVARVDLCAVARRVVADVAPRALAKGQSLALDAPPACAVPGDETLLEVLLRNLVDNAVRYSPHRATVQVTVQCRDGAATVSVADSGPGLGRADRQRLGERFFRVLGGGESGSGLGWSIVRRVAAVHGLTLTVEPSEALGGLQVLVSWPVPELAPTA